MAKQKYLPCKDGRYRAKVWDGTYNSDGSKHRIYLVSAKSSRDLELKVSDHNQRILRGEYASPSAISMAAYSVSWLKTYNIVKEASTRAIYEIYVNAYFKDCQIRMTDLKRSHIQNLINTKMEYPRACEMMWLTWKQIIDAAIIDQLIPEASRTRLCKGIVLPKRRPSDRRPLTEAEKRYIQEADFNRMEQLFVMLLYGTGVRKEEALALTIHDVDFEKKEIQINKAVGYDKGRPYLKNPKSDRGFRSVPLPDYLIPLLHDAITNKDGRFFYGTRTVNNLLTLSSYTKFWKHIQAKIEAAAHSGSDPDPDYECKLTAHWFRHNYCSALCYQIPKISIHKIAALLGDREDMVMNVYSHIIEEHEEVSEALSAAVGF